MSLAVLLCLREQAVRLRVRRQEQVTVFGVAGLQLAQVAEVKPWLPAFVAAAVHNAEVAGGALVVCSVALVSADWHYIENSLLRLLAAAVSAGAWERERCSGDEETVGPQAEMQQFLVFGASGWPVRAQEQNAVVAGADAAAVGFVGMVDAVGDNSVVVGNAARWGHLLSKNASPAWLDSVWLAQLPAGHELRRWCRSNKKEHNCPARHCSGLRCPGVLVPLLPFSLPGLELGSSAPRSHTADSRASRSWS